MEADEKNRVTITILGEDYILRSSSSVEEMQRVGHYVDRLMRNLNEQNIQMSRNKMAVLAALNLADDLLRHKEQKSTVLEGRRAGEQDHELA